MPDFSTLPPDALEFCTWSWERVDPYFADLLARELTPQTVAGWLSDWSRLTALEYESIARLRVATSQNTADEAARARMECFFSEILPPSNNYFEQLRERWVASGLAAPGYERQLEQLQHQKSLYCAANMELQARVEQRLNDFFAITTSQTVTWKGEELGLGWGINPTLRQSSRVEAEQLWRLDAARRMKDLDALRAIWTELFDIRCQMAANAGFANYIDYRWATMHRTHFSPQDSLTFDESIAQAVVPAVQRVHNRLRDALGVESLRPWDMPRTPPGWVPLQAFSNAEELLDGCSRIFHRLHPAFGNRFDELRAGGMFDLEPRPNKMGGGYSIHYAVTRQTFVSLNVRGESREVFDMIHEMGHSLLAYETRARDFLSMVIAGGDGGGEWTEMTSQAAEMLAIPFLARTAGGFYSDADAARAERELLEEKLTFLPGMAAVDLFQHWAYTHPEQGRDPVHCERKWLELQERYEPGVDWSGLDQERASTWLSNELIFSQPLFFVEYGISLLGALQIRRAALQDQEAAVARYRQSLAASGSGVSIPELYAIAGARFAFDADTLSELVAMIEHTTGKS